MIWSPYLKLQSTPDNINLSKNAETLTAGRMIPSGTNGPPENTTFSV